METRFQTSFIPKKPMVPIGGASIPAPKRHNTSLLMTLGVFIFIASLLAAGGAYAWKYILLSAQENYKQQLSDRERQFNIDLIEQLKRANVRIDLAQQIINGHLAMSQVFEIISRLTIGGVRFTSLDVSYDADRSGGIKIDMRGYGNNLASVAFQSDVLNQLEQYGLRRVVRNPMLSNPVLDSNGKVTFGLSATVDPSSLSYVRAVEGAPIEGSASDIQDIPQSNP